jgi:hypothetical protein
MNVSLMHVRLSPAQENVFKEYKKWMKKYQLSKNKESDSDEKWCFVIIFARNLICDFKTKL